MQNVKEIHETFFTPTQIFTQISLSKEDNSKILFLIPRLNCKNKPCKKNQPSHQIFKGLSLLICESELSEL